MTHDEHTERTLLAFLAGDLDEHTAARVDRHLLECADCWHAVHDDHAGRLAVEQLRALAPPALRDRIRGAIECAPTRGRRRRRWRAGALVVAALMAMILALSTLVVPRTHPRGDALASIVVAAHRSVAHAPAGRARAAGLSLSVETRRVPHGTVIVTTAPRSFPMPTDAVGMRNDPGAPWYSATRGWNVACYSSPRPTLLIGRVPLTELQQLASQLQRS